MDKTTANGENTEEKVPAPEPIAEENTEQRVPDAENADPQTPHDAEDGSSAEQISLAMPDLEDTAQADGPEDFPDAGEEETSLPSENEIKIEHFREEAKKVYDPDAPTAVNSIFDFVELFMITLVTVLLLVCFAFRHSVVDGRSMQNTLQDGETLIISDLFYTPKRGDVIVFEDYTLGSNLKKPLVKRVIAVAGDTVEIRLGKKIVDGQYLNRASVYVNGEKLKEDYVYIDAGVNDPSEDMEVTVPEGKIFVLGDHRNDSTDSRYFGCVDEDAVLGKVLLRVFPFDKFGKVD